MDGYRLYAASPADFVGSGTIGTPLIIAAATLEVYDDPTGGTRVTDLLTVEDAPQTAVVTDSFGGFRFQAPDTLDTLWVNVVGVGGQRYAVTPSDLAERARAAEVAAGPALSLIQGIKDDSLEAAEASRQSAGSAEQTLATARDALANAAAGAIRIMGGGTVPVLMTFEGVPLVAGLSEGSVVVIGLPELLT